MKKYIKHLVAVITLITSFGANAQNDSSLLWEISGNGLNKSSYIFGTIHMICQDDYIMTPVIENTLESVDNYYAEIDFTNIPDLLLMQESLKSEIPLSKRISVEDYTKLTKLLNENFQMNISNFEYSSLAALVSMITFKSFPCDQHKMYEMELLQMASKSNKKMGGLETMKEQLDIMNNSFDIKAIISMLEDFKTKGFESTNQMVKLYKEQRIEDLLNLMNESTYMTEETNETMLNKRNHNWIAKMPEIMKDKSTFFAVGAAHLGGKNGVISLLKEKGYQVTPIKL